MRKNIMTVVLNIDYQVEKESTNTLNANGEHQTIEIFFIHVLIFSSFVNTCHVVDIKCLFFGDQRHQFNDKKKKKKTPSQRWQILRVMH